ncbi:MAG TPA: 2OG-Fe(II) oxygenase [Bdellovibrionota bacterium]|nr:2OG-Fe(II) oxygenase [Bdellovibrionota bacterium]
MLRTLKSRLSRGYLLKTIRLPSKVRESVLARDWAGLDQAIRIETQARGAIFEALREEDPRFKEIEFIISIRSSRDYPDEDGIWHDDGSRLLAFSLSLTPEPESIEGGRLEIRKRGSAETESLPTPPYGTLIVFATGQSGFEHKINRVTAGERIIIAGWCT